MTDILELAGISFRSPGESGDGEAIHAVIHGCADADQIDPYSTLEGRPALAETQRWLAQLAKQNMLLAVAGEHIVGYNWITWWTEAGGLTLYLHLGQVLPTFRGQGIGTRLLSWSEARIRALAAEQGSSAMYGANASSTERDATRLLHDQGYTAVFTLAEMEYGGDFDHLHPLPLPESIEIRAAQPEHAESMWRARMDAYSEVPLFGVSAPNEEEIDEIRADSEAHGHLWRVAWAGNEIAAQIWCGIHEYEGSKTAVLDEVHTVPKFQRQGIGRALMIQVLLQLRDMDIRRVRLHTDDGNRRRAKDFYHALGFKTLKTFPRYRKPL